MHNKYFKNFIVLSIIFSFLALPIFSAKEAFASTESDGINNLIGGNITGSNSSYFTGVVSTASQLSACQKVISNAIEGLFSKGAESFTKNVEKAKDEVNSVPVILPDYISKAIMDTKNDTSVTKKNTEDATTNRNCLDAVGKIVVKKMIQNITLSAVNWIKTGNAGNPFFVTNTSKYFEDIGKNEILSFAGEVNDPQKYPYAKAYMQSIADKAGGAGSRLLQSTGDAVSSLAPDISTPKTPFNTSFTNGGWSAWDNLIQNPANNPLGFQIEASNELASRIESAKQDAKDALMQGNGYLSDQRCVDPQTGQPNGITREQDLAGKKARATDPKSTTPVCLKWETVTPGKAIADFATQKIGYTDHALLDANTLNDAIAAILDAALGRFSSEFTTNGLAGMSTKQGDYTYTISKPSRPKSVATDFPESLIGASDWLTQNPNFNIRTDLTQALIDEQRIYLDKLTLFNEIPPKLIKNIRQLDYCIPGPNPDWEYVSAQKMQILTGAKIEAHTTTGDFAQTTGGQIISSIPIVGTIFSIFASSDQLDATRGGIANFIASFLGIQVSEQTDISNNAEMSQFWIKTYNSYRDLINKIYFTKSADYYKYMPPVTEAARNEYGKISTYQQLVDDNTTKIVQIKNTISRLENIKAKIDSLNDDLTTNKSNEDDYETNLKPIILEFGRLSTDMYTGNAIANMDNLYKQANDELNYVKNDLLEGDYGCEKFMANLSSNPDTKAIFAKYGRRQPYPIEIDHLYTAAGQGGPFPYIPWTKTAVANTSGDEGFLYGTFFHNILGPYSSQTNVYIANCGASWLGEMIETGRLNWGGTDGGGNGTNQCGIVTKNFERRINVY